MEHWIHTSQLCTWAFLGKKKDDVGRGPPWAGTPLVQRSPEGVSSAAKSGRSFMVNRVSERPPWSKTRGEAA